MAFTTKTRLVAWLAAAAVLAALPLCAGCGARQDAPAKLRGADGKFHQPPPPNVGQMGRSGGFRQPGPPIMGPMGGPAATPRPPAATPGAAGG